MMDLGFKNGDGTAKKTKVMREATPDQAISVRRVHRSELDHPRVHHAIVTEKILRAHMGGDLTTYFDKPKNIHAETWSLIESGDHEKALKLHTAHHEGDHAQVRTIKSTIRRHHTRHARAKAAAVKAQAKKEADMGKTFAAAMDGQFGLPSLGGKKEPDSEDKYLPITAESEGVGPHGDADSVPYAETEKVDCKAQEAEAIPKDVLPELTSKDGKPKKVSLRSEREEDAEVALGCGAHRLL
jgi:hypothetical protein